MHVVAAWIRILAPVTKENVETKNCTLKCLKRHYSTVQSMKNVSSLTEDRAFVLFFRPHPGGFDSSGVPTPGNLPSKAKKKKMLMTGEGYGRSRSWLMHYHHPLSKTLKSVLAQVYATRTAGRNSDQTRGGTLGISGWWCAAGTLETLTYIRAISAEFC